MSLQQISENHQEKKDMSEKRHMLTENFTEYTHQYVENCEVVHVTTGHVNYHVFVCMFLTKINKKTTK